MISSILPALKLILDIAAYSALVILISIFIYVRSGHSIMIKYIEKGDEEDEEY